MILLAVCLIALPAAATFYLWQLGIIRLPPLEPPRDPFSLSLSGQESDGHIRLTWDRNAPAVRLATSAMVVITDGDEIRRMELNREQIRNGSVVYQRISDRVSFRLELSWGRHQISETWLWEGS